jgi:CheY-like chemotaxis protein
MPRILLIDDDDLVRESLQAQLEAAGHEVVQAAHGGEGLTEFTHGRFDVVVTDILMPTVEGLETIKRMRVLDPGVAIIAMSGGARSLMDSSSANTRIDVLKFAGTFGATRTLNKPFTRAELLQAIDDCLRGSMQARSLHKG